ncbi:MAG: bifunctional phosphoribosylaminoimidazolecarboxamide formyltransferase/IMP cyclohydrolase [Bacillota bacterium]|nr:bifunctional phosphoribosylaminoimidazolecarboxamide formyltransferase/IMP cyclohydrolase [Bacillota bacterium]
MSERLFSGPRHKIKRALISVSDKEGIGAFARQLKELGYHLISTGGTAKALAQAGVEVERVEDLTGFPEILNGRVKTLHPKIHAGILARDLPEDRAQLEQLDIPPIALVVVNLYPFRETVAQAGVTLSQALEQIDIGGPTLLRAAAKNFPRVTVVVNPNRYPQIVQELREKGEVSLTTRLELAREAFWHTAGYDAAISNYLYGINELEEDEACKLTQNPQLQKFPARVMLPLVKLSNLRYGENPHQEAGFYREDTGRPYGVAGARQFHGKELSFNNILDLNAALGIVSEFEVPAAVVIKHNTPAGVACAPNLEDALRRARDADPVAAYGGVVGLNQTVNRETALVLTETFFEAVIAPAYSEEALTVLKTRPALRVLCSGEFTERGRGLDVKRVSGGFLIQEPDAAENNFEKLVRESRVVTKRKPAQNEWQDLFFGWIVVKHVFSNGIVVARERETVGIGGGQVSRVDAACIALEKAGPKARGAALASDGFLPFPDTVKIAAKEGITAIIQPGGSIRDSDVIAAADEAGMAMVFTGRRHFKH